MTQVQRRGPALRAAASFIALAAGVLGGCALSTEHEAVPIADSSVPFALLEPDSIPVAAATTVAGLAAAVYLVKNSMIVPTTRSVADPTPAALIAQLAGDPTDAETTNGLRSELATEGGPPLVLNSQLNRGVATVNLASGFTSLDSDSQLFAIAQIVCTLTAQPGTGQVAFALQNAPVEVPLPGGTTTGNPVTAADYAVLVNP